MAQPASLQPMTEVAAGPQVCAEVPPGAESVPQLSVARVWAPAVATVAGATYCRGVAFRHRIVVSGGGTLTANRLSPR